MLHEKYSLRDAINRREPREYAQKIIRSAKDADTSRPKNQLDMIYNAVDSDLRRDLRKPEENSTISSYLAELNSHKHD